MAARSIVVGINFAACRKFTDFGQGFYTTTNLIQAQDWANRRVRRSTSLTATVLEYEVQREKLAALDCLAFTNEHVADFRPFIAYCRGGPTGHRRPSTPGWYDVVLGPVTNWPGRQVIKDADQISFHTSNAIVSLSYITMQTPPAGLKQFP